METRYKRDFNHTYLILELPVLYEEDYQIKMIQANQIEGLLPISGQGVDGRSQYFYEISEKTSLRSVYDKTELEKAELERFLTQFAAVLNQVQRYLLDMNRILLEPEYIFVEKEKYYFCYLPAQEAELCQEFHHLTEYFVSKISHKDSKGILLAYELHKKTMEENYNLEKIIERLNQPETLNVYEMEENIEEPYENDWIDYQEEAVHVLRENTMKWGRKKWGEWDG